MLPQFSFRERKRFWTIFTITLVLLCLWLLFAPNGVVRYYNLQQEIAGVREDEASLEEQNASLATDVNRLEKDPAYLEDLARDEYGLIRKNEMIFDFSRPSKKH